MKFIWILPFTGADDVKQLREADEDELQDILSDVEMTKPYHIKRFKKALENWDQGPTSKI